MSSSTESNENVRNTTTTPTVFTAYESIYDKVFYVIKPDRKSDKQTDGTGRTDGQAETTTQKETVRRNETDRQTNGTT